MLLSEAEQEALTLMFDRYDNRLSGAVIELLDVPPDDLEWHDQQPHWRVDRASPTYRLMRLFGVATGEPLLASAQRCAAGVIDAVTGKPTRLHHVILLLDAGMTTRNEASSTDVASCEQ